MIPNERTHECMTHLAEALEQQLGKRLVGLVHTVCVENAQGESEVYFFTQGPEGFMESPRNHMIMIGAFADWSCSILSDEEGEDDDEEEEA